MLKRKGVRLPQDRLNSGVLAMILVVPGSALTFGWTLQKEVGGMAVPVIMSFVAGAGLMGSFNGLNTYTAGNYSVPVVCFGARTLAYSFQRYFRLRGQKLSAENTSYSIYSAQQVPLALCPS